MSDRQEWSANLKGLKGLYIFVNHPARVKVLCHEDVFNRLMRESSKQVNGGCKADKVTEAVCRAIGYPTNGDTCHMMVKQAVDAAMAD